MENQKTKEELNKEVVVRWFTHFWGETFDLSIVDEIAAADMLLKYSLHEPRNGREDIKSFMTDFRAAFPDLNFWGTADLIAEGDSLPESTGRKMHFTGTTVLKVVDGKIVEEIGHLNAIAYKSVQVGLMVDSPMSVGFDASFENVSIRNKAENQ